MGVELETSRKSYNTDVTLDNNIAVDLRRPKTMWFAKYDASVEGPEFVSHPATLTYWQKQAPKLQEMFRLLVHGGFRSHNGGAAGMHINISDDAFEDARHVHRFLTLLYANYEWVLVMSQRTHDQASQWATNRPFKLMQAWEMMQPSGGTDKYSVVHKPYGQHRYEFRMPRGTLRLDRFLKNLEWTAAMVAFTRITNEYTCLDPYHFTNFASTHQETYSNLLAFLTEKESELNGAQTRDERGRSQALQDCDYPPQEPQHGPPRPRASYGHVGGRWTNQFQHDTYPYLTYDWNGEMQTEVRY